ncbi:hypothetical protein Tco_0154344 [Tanacetum coccineum]
MLDKDVRLEFDMPLIFRLARRYSTLESLDIGLSQHWSTLAYTFLYFKEQGLKRCQQTPFDIKERGLNRFDQMSFDEERGLNCFVQTSFDEERGLNCFVQTSFDEERGLNCFVQTSFDEERGLNCFVQTSFDEERGLNCFVQTSFDPTLPSESSSLNRLKKKFDMKILLEQIQLTRQVGPLVDSGKKLDERSESGKRVPLIENRLHIHCRTLRILRLGYQVLVIHYTYAALHIILMIVFFNLNANTVCDGCMNATFDGCITRVKLREMSECQPELERVSSSLQTGMRRSYCINMDANGLRGSIDNEEVQVDTIYPISYFDGWRIISGCARREDEDLELEQIYQSIRQTTYTTSMRLIPTQQLSTVTLLLSNGKHPCVQTVKLVEFDSAYEADQVLLGHLWVWGHVSFKTKDAERDDEDKNQSQQAQAKNADFLNKLDYNIKKIINDQVKEQVKAQVSKILPKIKKTVNEQLEAEVMTRSSTESKTYLTLAANLSELELKKILVDKMESNKSIHRSDEQKNLYKALRRRAGKEPESTSAPKEKTSKTSSKSYEGSKSKHKTAKESAQTEEPMHPTKYLEEPAHQEFEIGVTEDQPNEETPQFPNWFQRPTKLPSPDHDWNKTLPDVHGPVQP